MRDTSKRSQITFSDGMRDPFGITPLLIASFRTVNSWKYSGDADEGSSRSRFSASSALEACGGLNAATQA